MDFAQDYPSGEPTVGSVDLVDIDATTQTNMATATRVPMPSAVLGLGKSGETVRHVGIVGDSLMMGYLDTEVDSHKKGIGVRGAEYEDVRYRRIPQGGDRMMYWTAANAAKRLALVQPATSVFCDLGSNDIANSRTLAQLQADAITTWTELGRQGARVFQMTILPKTTSTDSWATKANQTPVAPAFAAGGVRQTFNAWLRAGASTVINGVTVTLGMAGHPLSGVVDISSAVEDTTDSNYWKSPSWTTDGGHPTATGYDALAQAMRPWMSSMVVGNQLKHAGLHAVGGPDPVTPASIGAADAATLGGYLPTLLPWGGFQDYLVRGDVMSSAPAQSATSTIAMSVTVRTIVVLLDYMTALTVNGLKFALQTAMVGGTASIAAYSGTNIAALARLGAAFAPTMTGTDVRSSALPTPQASAAGYYAIQLTLTGTAPSTYPVLAATPAVPSNCGLLANPPSGAIAAGSSTGTTAPGSTLVLSGTGGWTKLLQKPWFAEY
jgi:lysophospholipase L1-like esterase